MHQLATSRGHEKRQPTATLDPPPSQPKHHPIQRLNLLHQFPTFPITSTSRNLRIDHVHSPPSRSRCNTRWTSSSIPLIYSTTTLVHPIPSPPSYSFDCSTSHTPLSNPSYMALIDMLAAITQAPTHFQYLDLSLKGGVCKDGPTGTVPKRGARLETPSPYIRTY
jgi:hypothetical protein